MYAIISIIFFGRSLCTKGALRVQDFPNEPRYTPKSLHDSQGKCYEKPIGNCIYNKSTSWVDGCHCTSPAVVGFLKSESDEVEFVVCSRSCKAHPCPKAPKGQGICMPYITYCLIHCKNDKDCPETGVCTDPTDGVCMYRP